MAFELLDWVTCTACGEAQWERLAHAPEIVRCGACQSQYRVVDGILDLLPHGPHFRTPAQWTNFTWPVAWGYENLWRRRSLTLLSGEPFGFDRELALLDDWLAPEGPGLFVDLACSHGLYARSLARSASVHGAPREVIALDSSLRMLKQAGRRIRHENLGNVHLLCAEGEQLPLRTASIDGMVCGGSLNEFKIPALVIQDAARVLKPGAPFFSMHLLSAPTPLGRSAQQAAAASGIHFWPASDVHDMFAAQGLDLERQAEFGLVAFALYRRQPHDQ